MKIAMVKQECHNGDKATITGTVKWIGKVDIHQGQEGEFRTQSLLITDGEKTKNQENAIFCGFYADKGSWNHLKDTQVTVQGTVNVYNNDISLRGCKVVSDLPAVQKPQQDPSQPAQSQKAEEKVSHKDVWDKKDERMASINALNRAVELWIADKKPFGECSLFESADLMVDYIYKPKSIGGQRNPDYCGEGGTGAKPPDDEINF